MNMYDWIERMIYGGEKKAFPLLTYPAVQLLNITTRELVASSDYQAVGMRLIADRYDMPAAVGYMDLSVEAEAFGANAVYSADDVPTITGSIVDSMEDAENLVVPEIGAGRTGVNVDGIRKALKLITDRPLFGNCAGPFSLAGRLMNINNVMVYCYEEPEMVHVVLKKCTEFIIKYCKAQKAAGANGIIMAEPLAGLLSPELMSEFSSDYVRQIVDAVQDKSFVFIYHNCGNAVEYLTEQILDTGCNAFHFGDSSNMANLLKLIPKNYLVLGNISPSRLFNNGTTEQMRLETTRLLETCGKYKNFVLSSGCDVPPLTDFENIDMFFKTAESYYYRQSLYDLIN